MKARSVLLAVVAIVLVVTAPHVALAGGERDQNGAEHDLGSLSGIYTVVDFAASWCAPCRESLPRLESLAREETSLRVLVVSVDEEERGRAALVDSLGLTLPVIWDQHHAIAEHFRPPAMPSLFVLDPQGDIVYRHAGFSRRKWHEFTSFIEHLDLDRDPGEGMDSVETPTE